MAERSCDNSFFINKEEQEQIKNYPVIIVGYAIGHCIAEGLLRLGFEHITLIDQATASPIGSDSQLLNDDKQNKNNTEVLKEQLLSFNHKSCVTVYCQSISDMELEGIIQKHKVLVNTLSYKPDTLLILEGIAKSHQMPILHLLNLGWGGLVVVVSPSGLLLSQIAESGKPFNELKLLEYFAGYQQFWGDEKEWLTKLIEQLKAKEADGPRPQLSVGNTVLSAMCSRILFNLATHKPVKLFPEFYLTTAIDN